MRGKGQELKLQEKVWGILGSEGSQEGRRWRKKYEMEDGEKDNEEEKRGCRG